PLPTLTLMESAASCWITLAFDCAKTRSIVRPSAWKKPFLMPMWIGHRLVEPDDTPPAMMVSAAPRGGANRSETAMENAITLGPRASRPLLRYAGGTPAGPR